MNKFFWFILFPFCLYLASPAMAKESAIKLTIVTEDIYPLNYIDKSSGEFQGFAVDYLKDILELADVEYRLDVLPWARAYKIATTKPNVLIFGLARTATREDKFIWLTDFITLEFYLYGLRSRKDEISRTDGNYLNSRIGVIRHDYNHVEMIANDYNNLITADDHKHLAQLLLRNRADFIVAGGTTLNFFDIRSDVDSRLLYREQPLTFLNVPIYYALSKGTNPEIETRLRKAVAELKNDPAYQQPKSPTDEQPNASLHEQ